MMTPIVFEGKRPLQWDGRSWRSIRPAVADARIEAGEAYWWTDREMAEAWAFIPPTLKSTRAQRRKCDHEWVNITWKWPYRRQWRARWHYRCRKCGGYCR
jgi:hypothetical protein